jgi:hypothetical protein
VLFVAAAVIYLLIGLFYTSRLRVSGDEPHYLVMARSLWREGDLDLRDNYEREDWSADTPGPVRPHYGAPRRDGRPFPAHSPGLPLLLAPVDALAGRAGCVVLLALLAAWLTVEVRALALQVTRDSQAAVLAWAAAAGPPVAAYAFHVYTEVPSALALALGLRLLARPSSPPSRSSFGADSTGAVGAALCASALPWLHVKMVPAAAALGLVGLVRLRGRARIAFAVTAAAMGAGFLAYYVLVFGQASPLAIYGGVPQDASGSPVRALFGLLLDRSFGLLPHAPIFVLALAGLASLRETRRADLWPHVLVGAAVLLPILPWRMWWGGQCPPARFLVPLVPFLAVALALRARGPACGLLRWRAGLLLVGLGLFMLAVADPGRLLLVNRANLEPRVWAALEGERSLAHYLPALTRPEAADLWIAAVWASALALLLGLDHLARRHEGADRAFRGLGLPVVMLMAVGLVIDGWVR